MPPKTARLNWPRPEKEGKRPKSPKPLSIRQSGIRFSQNWPKGEPLRKSGRVSLAVLSQRDSFTVLLLSHIADRHHLLAFTVFAAHVHNQNEMVLVLIGSDRLYLGWFAVWAGGLPCHGHGLSFLVVGPLGDHGSGRHRVNPDICILLFGHIVGIEV